MTAISSVNDGYYGGFMCTIHSILISGIFFSGFSH